MVRETPPERRPKQAFQVVFVIVALLIVPAALTLQPFSYGAAIRQLACVQFYILPDLIDQSALGSDPCRAVRVVGLPAARDDGAQYRRLVEPTHRSSMCLAGREFHLGYHL
jgi:hypothetical protein